jgi:hypothetical protein
MKTYPISTSNQNVPRDVYLLAEISAMSGEIIVTYYADRNLHLWFVGDWIDDKPASAYLFEICKLTGDSEYMVTTRIESFFRCYA